MTFKPSKFTSAAAIAAALSMTVTPAMAAELPAHVSYTAAQVETGDAGEANQYRHWRRHRHRDRGIDAGDVVAGVLVVGAIAALAGAFDGDDDDRRERNRDYRDRNDRDYRARDYRSGNYESDGIGRAADICVEQVERGNDRVDEVSDASRRSDGWHVEGTLDSGEGWSCWIDNQGRIRNVDFAAASYSAPASDNRYAAAPASGEQWSDAAYARARANTRTASDESYSYRFDDDGTPVADGPQPAYPGGPLPGEEGYGEDDYGIDADLRPAG